MYGRGEDRRGERIPPCISLHHFLLLRSTFNGGHPDRASRHEDLSLRLDGSQELGIIKDTRLDKFDTRSSRAITKHCSTAGRAECIRNRVASFAQLCERLRRSLKLNQITRDNPIEAMSATRCFAAIQTMAQDLAYTLVTAKGK